MGKRVFGHIEGVPVGSVFASRRELFDAGVHRQLQAGIAGSEKHGAESIVLSGGYEDDHDLGEEIIYTGQGGRDAASGAQVRDQELNRGNRALALSHLHGLPVRVIRGGRSASRYGPADGYRYDGLYRVEDYWKERGRSGFAVWRYRLVQIREHALVAEEQAAYDAAPRREGTILRIVRDTEAARRIKRLYGYRCQVCGLRLEGTAGPYAEAAHIRPLGAPHDGPDEPGNLLCLCPNHHVLFDHGGFAVADDHALIGREGLLNVHPRHRISPEHLAYHREHYFHALLDED